VAVGGAEGSPGDGRYVEQGYDFRHLLGREGPGGKAELVLQGHGLALELKLPFGLGEHQVPPLHVLDVVVELLGELLINPH